MTKDELQNKISDYANGLLTWSGVCTAVEEYSSALIAAKPLVKCRLYEVKYHSSYEVWNQHIDSFIADTEAEALTKFWDGKNKESYEVMSVRLVNGT